MPSSDGTTETRGSDERREAATKRCGATIHTNEPSTADGRRCQRDYAHTGPHLAADQHGSRAWVTANDVGYLAAALGAQEGEQAEGVIYLCDCGIWGTGADRCGRCGSESLQRVLLPAEHPTPGASPEGREDKDSADPYVPPADPSLVGNRLQEASCDDHGDDAQAAAGSAIGTTPIGSATTAETSGTRIGGDPMPHQGRLFTEQDVAIIAGMAQLEGAPSCAQIVDELDRLHPGKLTRTFPAEASPPAPSDPDAHRRASEHYLRAEGLREALIDIAVWTLHPRAMPSGTKRARVALGLPRDRSMSEDEVRAALATPNPPTEGEQAADILAALLSGYFPHGLPPDDQLSDAEAAAVAFIQAASEGAGG